VPHASQSVHGSLLQQNQDRGGPSSMPARPGGSFKEATEGKPLLKTRMCTFMVERGHCSKGERCDFAHSADELRSAASLSKGKGQMFAAASSAEDPENNRYPERMKTSLCRMFQEEGWCDRGARCWFAHGSEDLRRAGAGDSDELRARDGGLTLGDFVTKSDKGKKPRTAQASSQPASSSGTVSAPGNNVAAAPPAGGGSGIATTPEDDEAALEALLFPQFE